MLWPTLPQHLCQWKGRYICDRGGASITTEKMGPTTTAPTSWGQCRMHNPMKCPVCCACGCEDISKHLTLPPAVRRVQNSSTSSTAERPGAFQLLLLLVDVAVLWLTLQPFSPSARAIARPIPLEPPVTTHTGPAQKPQQCRIHVAQ